ncbi:MAG: hypothetical protein HQL69_06735 [Magnetococcales bacterium]|nr:hypothetical protein [Magnetococcales bacterium]
MMIIRFGTLFAFLALFSACGSSPSVKSDTIRFNALYKKSKAYMERDNPHMALRSLIKARQMQPDHVGILSMLGVAYDKLGHDGKSLNVWQTAHKLKPKRGDISHNLGVALMRQQMLDEAKVAFDNALADPKFADRLETYYNLALIKQRRGAIREMVADLNKIIQIEPGHIPSHELLADYYRKMRRADLEEKQLRNILKINSQRISTLERLADLYLQSGKRDKAIPLLQRIGAIVPKTAVAKRAELKLEQILGNR